VWEWEDQKVYASKIDYIKEKYADKTMIFVSAVEQQNLDELKKLIVEVLDK
jgi:GTPase Era involved in 16S rRNA processing